jgi:cupin fold WbuC family metalloprotein
MVVQAKSDLEYPRHAHVRSDELIVVIRGSLRVRIWSEGADLSPKIYLLSNDLERSDGAAIYIPQNTLHDTTSLDSDTVYLESKLGPFDKNATVSKPVQS